MCGLAGTLRESPDLTAAELAARVERMAGQLGHRGPDDSGSWSDAEAGYAVSFRRLSIQDLSPAGHQPMVSGCGRWVLAMNGEIYNFRELRRDLDGQGIAWRGHSDSEVAVEAFAHWGVERTLARLVGMFAIALWDRSSGTLYLIRDRLGVKPLYWSEVGGNLLFGSELKALCAVPEWQRIVDPAAVLDVLTHGCCHAPRTIYAGVWTLKPGHLLIKRVGAAAETEVYWSLADVAVAGMRSRFGGTAAEAAGEVERLLREAVATRLAADVPVGAFLSGGLDSPLVVALAGGSIETFTVAIPGDNDESGRARRIAAALGTKHQEVRLGEMDLAAVLERVVERLPDIYDEPFADHSQIPTLLVSELAASSVRVVLTGDGGDEGLMGYDRYIAGPALWAKGQRWPTPIRRVAARVANALPESVLKGGLHLLPRRLRPHSGAAAIHWLAAAFSGDLSRFHSELTAVQSAPHTLLAGPRGRAAQAPAYPGSLEPRDVLRYLDGVRYLPDDILVKLDRATMSVGLEARSPFLDHRLIEFCWRLPPALLVGDGGGKAPLRRIAAKILPPEVLTAPKQGFSIPIGQWLRGPLRTWADSLLHSAALEALGVRPQPVLSAWRIHLSGERDLGHGLWAVLSLAAWGRRWLT